MSRAKVGLVPAPSWVLERDGDGLVVHGGADLRFVIADVTPAAADEVLAAWHSGDVTAVNDSIDAREIIDQLATVGALGPAVVPGASALSVAVRFVHRPMPGLVGAIDVVDEGIDVEEDSATARDGVALTVVVRTDGTLAELATVAATVTTAYLVVDVAYHHTVALGPLVVPGETACAGCLAGRVSARWGDRAPPTEPAAMHAPVAAALVAHEVAKVAAGSSLLVNRTVALDLDRWRTVDETVLRLPWCPMCGDHDATTESRKGREGRIDLPWARR